MLAGVIPILSGHDGQRDGFVGVHLHLDLLAFQIWLVSGASVIVARIEAHGLIVAGDHAVLLLWFLLAGRRRRQRTAKEQHERHGLFHLDNSSY